MNYYLVESQLVKGTSMKDAWKNWYGSYGYTFSTICGYGNKYLPTAIIFMHKDGFKNLTTKTVQIIWLRSEHFKISQELINVYYE